MPKIETTREPSPADQQAVRELFYAKCLLERGQPVVTEMMWVVLGCRDVESHKKLLPDYCYHIFDAFQRTYFKGFPSLSKTVQVLDPFGMTTKASIDEIKKVLRIDWTNLGRVVGIGVRSIRFAEMEAGQMLEVDGFNDLSPTKTDELFTAIFGKPWMEANREKLKSETPDELFSEMLNEQMVVWMANITEQGPKFSELAGQFSPEAMVQFSEGFTEGLTSFLDTDGQLAGESSRSGIYSFLLLVWPEIQAMLEANPKKTLSDLHEWMKPFMRAGLTAYIEVNTLRDVCASPPGGIGLSLRPLKSGRPAASA